MISERTRIANPIYDGAFKYLLDDNRVARFFLSVLMDEEVVELELRPTEHNTDIERKSLTHDSIVVQIPLLKPSRQKRGYYRAKGNCHRRKGFTTGTRDRSACRQGRYRSGGKAIAVL